MDHPSPSSRFTAAPASPASSRVLVEGIWATFGKSVLDAWRWFLARYCSLDRRSLGLFRIVFGTLLLCELAYRFGGIDHWYTNDGLMPNHVVLWANPGLHMFSFFFSLSTYGEALFGFALCGAVFVAYTVGFWTRLSQWLALVCVVSLNSRVFMLENGGDNVVAILAVLTAFLPLGDRFSLDALRRPKAESRTGAATPRGEPSQPNTTQNAYVSVACFALILQLAVIYLFNVVHKSGSSWTGFSAVHYTLHQDRLVTPLGVWMREQLPFEVLAWLCRGTLVVESLAVLLILSPLWTARARMLSVLLVPPLHLGFAACLDLGPFPYVMMTFFLLLVPAEAWHLAAPRWGATARRASDWLSTRLAAAAASPAPTAGMQHTHATRSSTRGVLREATAGLVLLAIVIDITRSNAAMPQSLRMQHNPVTRAIIEYPRMFQGWKMFAPEAPFQDFTVSVDAVTKDGRHVDPYNEVASPNARHVLHDVPKLMGQDQYFTSYSLFLPDANWQPYHHILEKWLLAHHHRTGDPSDEIVSFRVYQLIDDSPPPGETEPRNVRRNELMAYPR